MQALALPTGHLAWLLLLPLVVVLEVLKH